ncbi:MAG: hypothetical protein KA807_15400 [Prolixibacteraceae bacterium]|nr:hypothetical protein [Prolixibacteraceae bacterium]
MKRRNLATIFVMLILVSAIGVKAQVVLLPDGRVSNGRPLTAAGDDFIFGWSNDSPFMNNVLVLNGIPVLYHDCGWFTSEGIHDSDNENYICGYDGDDDFTFRNFFVFDLSNLSSLGITPPITSAILRIDRYRPSPEIGIKTWELYDVATSYSSFASSYSQGSLPGQDIFNDLGAGSLIGSVNVDRTLSFTPQVQVTLNSAGLAAINSSIGSYFILGGKADSIKPVPVPIWIIAIGFILIAGVVVLRFRRKRQLA